MRFTRFYLCVTNCSTTILILRGRSSLFNIKMWIRFYCNQISTSNIQIFFLENKNLNPHNMKWEWKTKGNKELQSKMEQVESISDLKRFILFVFSIFFLVPLPFSHSCYSPLPWLIKFYLRKRERELQKYKKRMGRERKGEKTKTIEDAKENLFAEKAVKPLS